MKISPLFLLLALVANKEVLVADIWEASREEGGWTPCFSKPFDDWKAKEVY